ncbi:MAG: hypothetical protein H6838_08140 [Planctomycetes bacterium]|nr:hypothetical protein [Planctomycetota bacterium]
MINPLTLLPFFVPFLMPHPHVPKAIAMQGAGGTTKVTWFTVPYNAEQVKTLPNGRTWHMGFASLEVGMPLQCGEVTIPVGKYKLDVLRADSGEFTELQLTPTEMLALRPRRGQQPDPAKVEAVKKDLAARGIPELIHLPAKSYDDPAAEHLEFMVLNRGFEAVQRGSSEPKGGASFTLMATFGDLHRKVDLVEVFVPPAPAKDAGK